MRLAQLLKIPSHKVSMIFILCNEGGVVSPGVGGGVVSWGGRVC